MRGRRNTHPKTSLLKLDGVKEKEGANFYLGKKVAYIYKAKKNTSTGNPYRVVWGKITRSHGTSGVVRAKFTTNLSPTTFGEKVRVMLYPSSI